MTVSAPSAALSATARRRDARRPSTGRPNARTLAIAALATALVPAIGGCAAGMNAQTQQQQPSGNGATANTVRIQARGLTIVSGAAKTATLIGTFVNVSGQDDALISVVVSNPTAKVSIVGTNTAGGVIPLPRTDSRKVGWDSTEHINLIGFEPTPSQFVTVELVYRDSGRATAQVLVVPPAGIYEGISPQLVPGA